MDAAEERPSEVAKAQADKHQTAPQTSAAAPAPAATQAPAPAVTQPVAVPSATPASIVNAPPENMYDQAASNLEPGSNLEGIVQHLLDMGGGSWDSDTVVRALCAAFNNPERAVEYLYSGIPEAAELPPAAGASLVPGVQAAQLLQAAQPAAVPSAGPNANPLDLFPQGLPDMGANAPAGAAGNLDFLRNSPQDVEIARLSLEASELKKSKTGGDRAGWSSVEMYEKYQEAVDALRHEQLVRKQSELVLKRVVHEVEAKADVIMDERVTHNRMLEAYDTLAGKWKQSFSRQRVLESEIQKLKDELKRNERKYSLAQREKSDLAKQVSALLMECRDIQLRGGRSDSSVENQLLTFKDINGLVEENVQLHRAVHHSNQQNETTKAELKKFYDKEFENHTKETASKVDAALAREEEQRQLTKLLHTSVATYKKLYEEEHERRLSQSHVLDTPQIELRNNVPLQPEGSHDARTLVKLLEEEATSLRSEIITLKSENNTFKLNATSAHEKLEGLMKNFDHQQEETELMIAKNFEWQQLILVYQRQIREAFESLHTEQDLSRKLNMEVSDLKLQKEVLEHSEKRAFEEVRSMSERLQLLQASLNTIQSAEEVREEARSANCMSQAKKELARTEERSKELANALEHELSDTSSMAETSAGNQDGSAVTSGPTEVKPKLNERVLRSSTKLAGNQRSPPVARGGGRIQRGRTRGGRRGRGGSTSRS